MSKKPGAVQLGLGVPSERRPHARHQFNGRHEQIGRPLLSSGENLTLIERLMLTEENTLMYEYTVKDPTIWVSDWTAQHPMRRNPESLYEFACHEGNYGLYNVLAGSRKEEAEAATQRR